MSGDSESRAFEVERRVRGHRPVPEGFQLSKEYKVIYDRYMGFDPDARARYGEIIRERGSAGIVEYPSESPRKVGKLGGKEPMSGEVMELETIVGDPRATIGILGMVEMLVVKGSRKAYENKKGVVITHDKVHRLGDFTEYEILADNNDARIEASHEVDTLLNSLGIKKSEYLKSYPHQILQLEVLQEIYRTPITLKELSTYKLCRQFNCGKDLMLDLCDELTRLGWISGRDGQWEPVAIEREPETNAIAEAVWPELEVNSYVGSMVRGEAPLVHAAQARKLGGLKPLPKQLAPSGGLLIK